MSWGGVVLMDTKHYLRNVMGGSVNECKALP